MRLFPPIFGHQPLINFSLLSQDSCTTLPNTRDNSGREKLKPACAEYS